MTNRVIKICNFVHYFFREGGYIDSDQFSLLLFSLFMVGGGVQMEIVPNSLFPLFFFGRLPLGCHLDQLPENEIHLFKKLLATQNIQFTIYGYKSLQFNCSSDLHKSTVN